MIKKTKGKISHRFYLPIYILLMMTACVSNSNSKQSSDEGNKPTAVLAYKIDAQLGEGAFWNHKTQELFWVDVKGRQLHIYNPQTKINRSLATPSRIGTVVPSAENEAVIGLEDGVYMINTQSGALRLLAPIEADVPENRLNDGKCDPAGRLWIGSMDMKETDPKANLYKVEPDGTTTLMLNNITISNGIVWTSDTKTMYYIDTPTHNIRAFDFDNASGTISNERIAVAVDPAIGFPDGMAIDEEDMLWVGLWNGNAVARFNPKTGALLSKIEVPANNVTACAFGGKDLDTLYITTACADISPEERNAYPNAGAIFKAVPGVKGVKSSLFGVQ